MIAYGARMHFIQSQTHNGTHAEGSYKHAEEGPDMAGMPLASFLGEAVVGDFSAKAPGEPIEPDDLGRAGVRRGDIVLPLKMTRVTATWTRAGGPQDNSAGHDPHAPGR